MYDTIYAHQDKDDDIVVGIKSTALLFGENTRACLAAFATTSIGFLSLTGASSLEPMFDHQIMMCRGICRLD